MLHPFLQRQGQPGSGGSKVAKPQGTRARIHVMSESLETVADETVKRPRRRGVYVIPTSLSVLNVFFGFTAMLLAIRASTANAMGFPMEAGRLLQLACISIIVAAIFDTFDGFVARLMNATSDFGKEYDSLADVLTFGAAPALMVYVWALSQWGRLGGGFAFLFLVAGSLRLARFNTLPARTDHRYFIGLPIPAAALTLCAIINYAPHPIPRANREFALVMLLVTVGLAFCMVSTIRYRSQKYANLQRARSFTSILLLALILVLLYRWPAQMFLLTAVGYVTSGPLLRLWSIAFPRPSTFGEDSPALDPAGNPVMAVPEPPQEAPAAPAVPQETKPEFDANETVSIRPERRDD